MCSARAALRVGPSSTSPPPSGVADPCSIINCGLYGWCDHTTNGTCRCVPGFQGVRCLSSPESRRRSFVYSGTDFDSNGLMYYLATGLNTTTWANPETRGYVATHRSSNFPGTSDNDSRCALSLYPVLCETNSDPLGAWWTLDMSEYVVQLTGYSLRDGCNTTRTMLRYFVFYGSVDGRVYSVIGDSHQNDRGILTPFGSYTWIVPRTQAFRYFKVLQTDRNAGGTYFLSLSGIELYGTLYGACLSHCVVCVCTSSSVTGIACADPHDECANINCGENGDCTVGGICTCHTQYDGMYCQNLIGAFVRGES